MPVDMSRYPPDWKEISQRVKEAAGWKCAFCSAPHGQQVTRVKGGFWSQLDDEDKPLWHDRESVPMRAETVAASLGVTMVRNRDAGFWEPDTRHWVSKVILTTAHLGDNRHDKMNCTNLAALCQSCHLAYDHADHIQHAKETRWRRIAASQPALFEVTA